MDTKLVLRAMDGRRMLGWTEVSAHARGDGRLWVETSTSIPVEEAGLASSVLVHWCDVNVAVTNELLHAVAVKPGDRVLLEAPWCAVVCGPASGGLPPVTVRAPVVVAPSVGRLGALGVR